jgi:NAD(P)-dependent dehydrogenase (short-subunit alcohol dehydrogenase family)
LSPSKRRVWLVTGANSGSGRAIVEAAVAAGDLVVATARSTASLEELVARHPDRVDPVQLDVTDHARIATVVDDAVRHHGRIDVLVNHDAAATSCWRALLMHTPGRRSASDSSVVLVCGVRDRPDVQPAASAVYDIQRIVDELSAQRHVLVIG